MKTTIKKVILITMFLVTGIPALINFMSNGSSINVNHTAYAQTAGYYRLDLQCYYQCGSGLCTGSQCNVSGTGCNVFNACSK